MFFTEIKQAFKRVKRDIFALKTSFNEWVVFLNSNQRALKVQVLELERKVAELEKLELKKTIEIY